MKGSWREKPSLVGSQRKQSKLVGWRESSPCCFLVISGIPMLGSRIC